MDAIVQVIIGIFFAGATYGAIRADLRGIHKELEDHHESINDAHHRIDDLLMKDK